MYNKIFEFYIMYVLEFGITQNWFQKVVSRDHQSIRLRRQNSIRSEQQIEINTPVDTNRY